MSINASTAVHINDLVFSYPSKKPLLRIPDWKIPAQSQTFLYGPSGSGKSTLLNLLSGILLPQTGSITLFETPFSSLSARQRDKMRAQYIGVVFQEFNLIPFLTVSENIILATHFAAKKQPIETIKEYAANIFDRLQLSDEFLTQRADRLSVGQQQRVSIARALINKPKLLIADEPTSALDTNNRDEFMQLLLDSADDSDCTVLFVSHDQSLRQHFSCSQDITELLDNHSLSHSNLG